MSHFNNVAPSQMLEIWLFNQSIYRLLFNIPASGGTDHRQIVCLLDELVKTSQKFQMGMLVKFHKQLFTVFKKIHHSNLRNMKTLVHGDSKVDNFMFKKVSWSIEDEYMALLVDWQGAQ